MIHSRRAVLLLPFAAAACADDPAPRQDFSPLRYEFLTKLRLNVGEIVVEPPPPPGPLDQANPSPPGPALQQMARDRLIAGETLGRAVFMIDDATVRRSAGGLEGSLAVHLDVLTSEGTRSGFAEARVTRQSTGIGDLRAALYAITQQMMQDMNVEFEFQVRRSLRDWLQEATVAPPPAVEQQPLGAPRL